MTVLEPVISFLLKHGGRTVELSAIIAGAERPRRAVLRVLDCLVREGYLTEIEDNKINPKYGEHRRCRRNPTWLINKKPLSERPEFIPKKRSNRDRIWQIIRMKRRFTRNDLEIISGVSRGSIDDYTKLLERQGVIRPIGKDSWSKVYLLVKDFGVKRPLFKGGDKRGTMR